MMLCLSQQIIASPYFPSVLFTVNCHIISCANKVSPNFQIFSSLWSSDHSCKTFQIKNEMKRNGYVEKKEGDMKCCIGGLEIRQ